MTHYHPAIRLIHNTSTRVICRICHLPFAALPFAVCRLPFAVVLSCNLLFAVLLFMHLYQKLTWQQCWETKGTGGNRTPGESQWCSKAASSALSISWTEPFSCGFRLPELPCLALHSSNTAFVCQARQLRCKGLLWGRMWGRDFFRSSFEGFALNAFVHWLACKTFDLPPGLLYEECHLHSWGQSTCREARFSNGFRIYRVNPNLDHRGCAWDSFTKMVGVLSMFEVLLGAQWLTTDAWLLLPGARILHCFCSKDAVFLEGWGCGSDRHLWLEQSGRTFQDYHGCTGEMQGRGRGYIKSGSEVMKHDDSLGPFCFVKKPKWNKHWTITGCRPWLSDCSIVEQAQNFASQDLHVTKNETRKARSALFLFELDALTSCNFEAFPEVKSVYVRCQVGLQFRTPDSPWWHLHYLAFRSTSWRKYVEIL